MAESLPTVITAAGLTPLTPLEIRAKLLANILATNPGYTVDLPGSLIEDINSTDVAAIYLMENGRVASVNDITPYGANAFVLNQQGQMFGVPYGDASNTSVFVQFRGTPGFTIEKGFLVGDGVYQYVLTEGGTIGTDTGDGTGLSALLFAVATETGAWAVPSGTVQELLSNAPGSVTLTVNNPFPGTPAESAETEEEYRAKVYQAQLANATGTPTMLKTLVGNVEGVQARLVSVVQLPLNAGWQIIVGGGDPYLVAGAILEAGVDLVAIEGSTLNMTAATKANPCAVTVDKNHGYSTGQVIGISGVVGMTQLNGTTPTITVTGPKSFTLNGVNSTGYGTYVSGGVVTPNLRNVEVDINGYPDTYEVVYVNPPQQVVTVTLTWQTNAPNFVSESAVTQKAQPAIAAYINSIVVGQPINLFQMENAFKASVVDILSPDLIIRMVWVVTIDGIQVNPTAGTGIVEGDPESYFFATSTDVTVNRG